MDLFKIKAGSKTTENIYAGVGSVLSLAIALGYISPDMGETIVQVGDTVSAVEVGNLNSMIDGGMRLVALAMGGTIASSYIKGRSAVKAAVGKGQNLTEDVPEEAKV